MGSNVIRGGQCRISALRQQHCRRHFPLLSAIKQNEFAIAIRPRARAAALSLRPSPRLQSALLASPSSLPPPPRPSKTSQPLGRAGGSTRQSRTRIKSRQEDSKESALCFVLSVRDPSWQIALMSIGILERYIQFNSVTWKVRVPQTSTNVLRGVKR